jgi:CheY-like chemotaxis protein
MRFTENDLVDETRNLVSAAPECLRAWSWLLWTSPTVADNVSGMTVPLLSELERLGTVSSLASYLLADMKDHLEKIYRESEEAGPPAPWRVSEGPAQGPPRILIVDDDALFPMLLVRLLRDLGYQSLAVASGERALEALRAAPFDAVLMDCQMPGLDGYETTRRVRRLEARAELAHHGRLPIIAVTGQPRETAVTQCLAAGMDEFLSKPPSAMELVAALDRWLAAR